MRSFRWTLIAGLAGCQAPASPGPAPELPEPAVFAAWPPVTEKPVRVGPGLWALCVAVPRDAAANPHRPGSDYSIVVRVSPGAAEAFRQNRPLPPGAVVVKEKYADATASGPLQAYAVMTKRAAGFDRRGGDWEYAYVALAPERTAMRGRLAECSGCHASARRTDYLFRTYGGAGR